MRSQGLRWFFRDYLRVKAVFALTLAGAVLLFPSIAQAQGDSGSITVSGSVAPAPTTITTAVTASGTNPIGQNQDITYTITYSSSNVTAVPLHFKAVWDKGTVDGATEANVDVVTYVLGSATAGYGATSPVVDTLTKHISWDIPALAAGAGQQQVQFKLRTTTNYTGSRTVSFPVSVLVISPVGVSDKVVTKNYQFVPLAEAASPTPSPTSTYSTPYPTATGSGQAVQPTVPESISSGNAFEAISFPTVGASSARIRVKMTFPTDLVIRFGSNPSELFNKISLPVAELSQDFVLVNLQPETTYYFQVQTNDGGLTSDLFTFETASKVVEQEARAMNITMTQDRNVVYFGPPTSSLVEQSQPIVMTRSSIIDLTVKVPNSGSIKQIEVLIRNVSVLGASTDEFNLDELQSSTTKLAKVGDDLFVGKLRVPEDSGSYEVVSRIEDIYGNITEREVQLLSVVQPFRVVDETTGNPLQHAKVILSIFNPDTRMYQVVSNVTSNVRNPSFSKTDGAVEFILLPSRYKAEVTLLGYHTQVVEFEVGSSNTDYPQVKMVKSSWVSNNAIQGVTGFVTQTGQEIVAGILSLNHIDQYYQITLVATLILLVTLTIRAFLVKYYPTFSIDVWMAKRELTGASRFTSDFVFLSTETLRFIAEVLVFHTQVMGVVFLYSSDPRQGILLLGICAVEFSTLVYTGLLIKHRHLDREKK